MNRKGTKIFPVRHQSLRPITTFLISLCSKIIINIINNQKKMRLFKYIFSLIKNVKNNNGFGQFLAFILLLLVLAVIGVFTLIKVAIPFTYVAL